MVVLHRNAIDGVLAEIIPFGNVGQITATIRSSHSFPGVPCVFCHIFHDVGILIPWSVIGDDRHNLVRDAKPYRKLFNDPRCGTSFAKRISASSRVHKGILGTCVDAHGVRPEIGHRWDLIHSLEIGACQWNHDIGIGDLRTFHVPVRINEMVYLEQSLSTFIAIVPTRKMVSIGVYAEHEMDIGSWGILRAAYFGFVFFLGDFALFKLLSEQNS